MAKVRKGRPPDLAKKKRNADRVFLRLARDRNLAAMSDLGGKNLLSGRKLKGQQRAPRSITKEVLPEVSGEIQNMPSEDQDGLSPRTLERHYAEHGKESFSRIVGEIQEGLRRADAKRDSMNAARAEKHRPIVERLNRLAKAQQQPKVRKVFRKKKISGRC